MNVSRALRIWLDESAARRAGKIRGGEESFQRYFEEFARDECARCAFVEAKAQRAGRDRGGDVRVPQKEEGDAIPLGPAAIPHNSPKFPIRADHLSRARGPSAGPSASCAARHGPGLNWDRERVVTHAAATKRTQTKPIEANANPHWPIRNAEMCHRRRCAGDETNPLRRQAWSPRRREPGNSRRFMSNIDSDCWKQGRTSDRNFSTGSFFANRRAEGFVPLGSRVRQEPPRAIGCSVEGDRFVLFE